MLGLLLSEASRSASQIAALPTEMDASFRRALPMLQTGYIHDDQVEAAHRILYACSMTYVASSFAGTLHFWPWMDRGRMALRADDRPRTVEQGAVAPVAGGRAARVRAGATRPHRHVRHHGPEQALRSVAKPLIRRWLSAVSDAQY